MLGLATAKPLVLRYWQVPRARRSPLVRSHAVLFGKEMGRSESGAMAQGGIKAFLFNFGFKRKLHFIEQGYPHHTVCCHHHTDKGKFL